ncbi:calcineurin is a calcium-dependent protein [Rutstroemia sp. NJR-2017a WRK4]|nr:calcineurin is a calcium-dependent protein [Rutstroemia sp. NJR-2017a WRK4]
MSSAKSRKPLAVADSNATSLDGKTTEPAKKKSAPKRKASEIDDSQNEPLPEIDSDDERLYRVDLNCDQVRRKIRSFLESGEMKVSEFQRAIGASSRSYTSFMGQNGRDKGSMSDVYPNAFAFFKKRELQGIKPPKKKKISKEEENKQYDVSGIHLDGEEDASVPIYDSCDEIRKKINAHLTHPGVTQAGFCREIAKTYPDGKKIAPKTLHDFLSKKGPTAGNTSSVYYAAYVFFEKMRIRDKKPKSKHREEMEKVWSKEGGVGTERPYDRYLVGPNERPVQDKYGHITFMKIR